MQRAVPEGVYAQLCSLRALVARYDDHPACVQEPHSRRATTLLRFLRARGSDTRLAAKLFGDAMRWRSEFEVDRKLAEWKAEWADGESERARLMHEHEYIKLCGSDRNGCPVYVHQMVQGDPVGIAREVGEETVLLHYIWIFEEQTTAMRAQFLKTGRVVPGCVDIYDTGNYAGLPGAVPRALAKVPYYMGFARIFEVVYPERLHVAFVLRAPHFFDVVWRAASSAIPEATRRKCRIFSSRRAASAWREEVGALVPPESVPPWLRTDDAQMFGEAARLGGLVPRRR